MKTKCALQKHFTPTRTRSRHLRIYFNKNNQARMFNNENAFQRSRSIAIDKVVSFTIRLAAVGC